MSKTSERSSSSCRNGNIATASSAYYNYKSWMVAALVLLAGKSSFSLRLASLHPTKPASRLSTALFSKMPSPSSKNKKLMEVEQKFAFSDRSHLEDQLRKRGFVPVKELTMVDWYFDRFVDGNETDSKDLEMPLIRRDHWLRYRESITNSHTGSGSSAGQWELKRGNKGGGGGGATVYEEIEGIQAVEIVRSLLQEEQPAPSSRGSGDFESTTTFDEHTIPVLPIPNVGVAPFARIVTHRSKWKQDLDHSSDEDDEAALESNSLFSDLVVDLDTTPDGYAVGEVEAVVKGDDSSGTETEEVIAEANARNDRAVAEARERIQNFLATLLEDEDSSSRPPMGKLEQFLSQNRPRIYEACIESGVIPKRPSPPPPSNKELRTT